MNVVIRKAYAAGVCDILETGDDKMFAIKKKHELLPKHRLHFHWVYYSSHYFNKMNIILNVVLINLANALL